MKDYVVQCCHLCLFLYIFLVYINVLSLYFQESSTPVMLAVIKGHKDVVMLLMQKRANLDFVNKVSVGILILYHKQCITENK